MPITRIDVKLLKLHKSIERMWKIFFASCNDKANVKQFIFEKEACHNLMSEISEEANKCGSSSV